MRNFLICLLFMFYCACTHNDCCSVSKRQSEIVDYRNNLSVEEKKEYQECKERYLGSALAKCRPGYCSKVITMRCVNHFIHEVCSKEY